MASSPAKKTAADTKIHLAQVRKEFPSGDDTVVAIEDFTLDVRDGEFLSIVGPSGCGKTTLLRILAGLEDATSGRIEVTRSDGNDRPENAVVFQEYGIFPWKTVRRNVEFGLTMRGVDKAARRATVDTWLEKVGLTRFANSYPHQLSGGMKQRVSIIRALANDPEVLLMDEPLAALDAQTRLVMQEELTRLWAETRKTVVYITHSIDEALFLSDRVVVMSAHPGAIKAVYEVPAERPRSLEMMKRPEIGELSLQIWHDLKNDAVRGAAA